MIVEITSPFRMGEPEVARAVAFLASPAGDYLTGTVFFVDGGKHLARGAPRERVTQRMSLIVARAGLPIHPIGELQPFSAGSATDRRRRKRFLITMAFCNLERPRRVTAVVAPYPCSPNASFVPRCITPTRRDGSSLWPSWRQNRTSLLRCSPLIPRRRSASLRRTVAAISGTRRGLGKRARCDRACGARRGIGLPCSAKAADGAGATAFLGAAQCTDAMRADVARRAPDEERRCSAIDAIREEALLVELALTAEHAGTRMAAAAARSHAGGPAKLAEAARDKDRASPDWRGNSSMRWRIAKTTQSKRMPLWRNWRRWRRTPGRSLRPLIELNRRWQALNLNDDPLRLARCEAARQALQARFDREHAEQRARMQFEHRLSEWLGRADPPATSGELDVLRSEVAALRAEGQKYADTSDVQAR